MRTTLLCAVSTSAILEIIDWAKLLSLITMNTQGQESLDWITLQYNNTVWNITASGVYLISVLCNIASSLEKLVAALKPWDHMRGNLEICCNLGWAVFKECIVLQLYK